MSNHETRKFPVKRSEQEGMVAFNEDGNPVVYYDEAADLYLRVMCTAEDTRSRVETIADQIAEDYQDRQPFVVLSIEEGGNPLTTLLADALQRRGLQFNRAGIRATAVNNPDKSTAIDWGDTSADIVNNQHVLLVDDVISSGTTINAVRRLITQEGAMSSNAAILVDGEQVFPDDKIYQPSAPHIGQHKNHKHYYSMGIDTDSLFNTYGMGMDMEGQYRDLPCVVAAFKEEGRAVAAAVGPPGSAL